MAIEITREITSDVRSPRITEPLTDQFTMVVQTGVCCERGPIIEPVRVPGVDLTGYGPRFAQGYAWGRDCYYGEIDDSVNADGTLRRGRFTLEELETGAVRIEKIKDLRPGAIVQLIREVMEDDESGVPLIERVGCIVGYIATCVENFYGLACEQCGRGPGLCNCQAHS
jgi:hypothetical protein